MNHLFAPEAPVSLTIHGSDQTFPVRRVYCVGRNYAAHAREMGFDPEREPPFFFCKPADAVVPVAAGSTLELAYPSQTGNYHYEIELVAAIGKGGCDIPLEQAEEHVWGRRHSPWPGQPERRAATRRCCRRVRKATSKAVFCIGVGRLSRPKAKAVQSWPSIWSASQFSAWRTPLSMAGWAGTGQSRERPGCRSAGGISTIRSL